MYKIHFSNVPLFVCFLTVDSIYIVPGFITINSAVFESREVISRWKKSKIAMIFIILTTRETGNEMKLFFLFHYWERVKGVTSKSPIVTLSKKLRCMLRKNNLGGKIYRGQ